MNSLSANHLQTLNWRQHSFRLFIIAIASLTLVTIVLTTSPNFQFNAHRWRSSPGSDFLQEWTGGYIWQSDQRSELYSPNHHRAVQHNAAIMGYTWPEDQYYPMVYPPFYYMLLSPLSQLPYSVAAMVWMLVLGAATTLTLWSWVTFHPSARQYWGTCLIGTLAYFPFLLSINTAHKSIFLLLLLSISYLLLLHRRLFWSGLAFGLIAFKPHLGIVIGLAMLMKKQWSFIVGCGLTVGLLIGLSFVAGTDLCSDYFWQVIQSGNYASNGGYQLTQSHHLLGLVSLMLGTDHALVPAVFAALGIGLTYLLWIALKGEIDTASPRFSIQFSVLVFATVLASPHFYAYDLTILLLPISLIFFSIPSLVGDHPRTHRLLIGCCVGLYALTGVSDQIAEWTRLQPTAILIAATIYILANEVLRKTECSEDAPTKISNGSSTLWSPLAMKTFK